MSISASNSIYGPISNAPQYSVLARKDTNSSSTTALSSEKPFALAGLWERWHPPQKQTGLDEFSVGKPTTETEAVETFTIVTTEPNGVVEPLHDRMAVVLSKEHEDRWLAGDGGDVLTPYPADGMEAYPVSTAVNDPQNDSPELVERAAST